ncbi:hypothetical protein DOM21_03235 [Bacteriovorax stolpii]|uniref:Uncharacterized protein n=1 Tax=Bacteriovorax stolpii TaxID=960 RepID=A0A2K9NVH7_BACTC|nr:hypothetical protein [Bacteriovorax stolpii]AUN99521.1 hypothetical protein C0V70_15700 [Bacteriovorax stolpii]QDK40485.1 hypothetical protein DOM21_03235 [Bacteriovorax stolpii]TDP51150.1 hypothetical protein C8D79_3321 [Bacteriovorax stolpii]
MHSFIKKLSLLCCLFFLSPSAHALFFTSGALKAGLGTQKTEDGTTIQSRKLAAYSLDANLALSYFGFIAGVNGEYGLWRQMTKPSEVGNSNTQGSYRALSPVIGYQLSSLRVLLKLPISFSDNYKFDKKNSSSQTINYTDSSTFSLQLHWDSTPVTFWGVEYQKTTFEKSKINNTESALSSKFTMNAVSLMYGLHF